MLHRAIRVASLTGFALFVMARATPASGCPISKGAHLVLVSQELDPDVFLWDSADRLVRYAMGDYTVGVVLKHTTLLRAFTRAVGLGCKGDAVHASFTGGSSDAIVYIIGVRIISGGTRGRYGWVLSTDIRGPDGRQLTARRQRR
jgi:hypothetical protein